MSCSIAAGKTGYRPLYQYIELVCLRKGTHEEGVVDMFAEDIDSSGSSDDMSRCRVVSLGEGLDQVIPSLPGKTTLMYATNQGKT